jgi:TonB family protein
MKTRLSLHLLPLLFASLLAPKAQSADQTPPPATTPAAPADAGAISVITPCKIKRTQPIDYPLALLRDGISHGEARVLASIDADGRLTEFMILGYTHKPFADSALEALAIWKFEPARVNGEPVGTVADITFRFEVNGILLVERVGVPQYTPGDTYGRDYAYRPHGLRSLDAIPNPLHIAQPIYPKEWIDQGHRGTVTVDFYIDETGAVRMPSVSATQNPLLAAAASAAVREWKFTPPQHKGRPVLAHCQQVFKFEPESPKP